MNETKTAAPIAASAADTSAAILPNVGDMPTLDTYYDIIEYVPQITRTGDTAFYNAVLGSIFASMPNDDGCDLAKHWTAGTSKTEKNIDRKWASFTKSQPDISSDVLIALAVRNGYESAQDVSHVLPFVDDLLSERSEVTASALSDVLLVAHEAEIESKRQRRLAKSLEVQAKTQALKDAADAARDERLLDEQIAMQAQLAADDADLKERFIAGDLDAIEEMARRDEAEIEAAKCKAEVLGSDSSAAPASKSDHTMDLEILQLMMKAGDVNKILAYCKTLDRSIAGHVRPMLQEAFGDSEELLKINKRLTFKGAKLSAVIRADLIGWGFGDTSLNLMDDTVEFNGETATDYSEAKIRVHARDDGYGQSKSFPLTAIDDVIRVVAKERSHHPIKDYLENLKWDGENHIARLCSHITESSGSVEYSNGQSTAAVHAFLHRWLIGSVAKIFSSGPVLVQNMMLVLSGPQGVGKSSFIRWLCPIPEYFIESPVSPESKDHIRHLANKWVWEICELGSTTRKADRDALKGFLTKGVADFRVPFAKHGVQKPAITSFIGSINPDNGYLNDPTGDRRFATLNITNINFRYTDIDINQIWAEAMHYYNDDPTSWKFTPAEDSKRREINGEHKTELPFESNLLDCYEFGPEQSGRYSSAEIVQVLHDRYGIQANPSVAAQIGSTLVKLGSVKKSIKLKGVGPRKLYTGLKLKPVPRSNNQMGLHE